MLKKNIEPQESQPQEQYEVAEENYYTPTPSYKTSYKFGFVKSIAAITMAVSILGVIQGISIFDGDIFSFSFLAASWALLVFSLIPWTLVKIAQQQKDHFENVERLLIRNKN
ncbi:MAG: hypothetical protein GX898_00045, partial [Corynebacterium sp.]|nr:hypothetical protein [Corynebacterium sp.]